jgi:hypothetical protein
MRGLVKCRPGCHFGRRAKLSTLIFGPCCRWIPCAPARLPGHGYQQSLAQRGRECEYACTADPGCSYSLATMSCTNDRRGTRTGRRRYTRSLQTGSLPFMLRAMKAIEPRYDRCSWIAAAAVFWAVIYLSGCASLSDWRHAWARPSPGPSDRFRCRRKERMSSETCKLPPPATRIRSSKSPAATTWDTRRWSPRTGSTLAAGQGHAGGAAHAVRASGWSTRGTGVEPASMRLFYYPKPDR